MKLLLKFNLVFLLVFAIGLAASAYVARDLLRRDATAEVIDRARLLMDKAQAVSTYTAEEIQPLLKTQMQYSFQPQSVPAYSAIQVLNALHKVYPEFGYKQAMLNPTNPRDRAQAWEEDVVTLLKNEPARKEFVGQRDTSTGPSIYLARPIRISNAACLQCHSTAAAAPATLVEKYGPNNGFGWRLEDTLGAQVVSVPLAVPLQRADDALKVVVGLLTTVFLLIAVALNLMLWKLVIQPVSRLSAISDRVSMGELEAPAFVTTSKDEIGVLAQSFGRMRQSLVHAMKLLDA